jgi:queuine tRNA-ribosyltransferase
MKFEVLRKDPKSAARTGVLETDHGKVDTPVFMPVGTGGTVKGVLQRDLAQEINAQIILGNTYHLYLRPGTDVISGAGGLHQFISWSRPILTDSGGYQVFSLADNRKLSREGAAFQSHIDGSGHFFTPERVVTIQKLIGADITMAFDECTPYPCSVNDAEKSMQLTHLWLDRGMNAFDETEPLYGYEQVFFPIVQGSTYPDLRKASAEKIASCNREGNAIGGLSVGEPEEQMYEMTAIVNRILPEDKPRYLMGVGTPANILESISLGVDMFDCVIPTRNGRNGMLYTRHGIMNMKNQQWKNDHTPIDPEGPSHVSRQYSKAYLRHLFVSGELLGAQIATIHNLSFYLWLMEEARKKIVDEEFSGWKDQMVTRLMNRI